MKSVFEVPRQSRGLGSSGFRTMCGLCDISHKPSSWPRRPRNTVTSSREALSYRSCAPPSPAAPKSTTIGLCAMDRLAPWCQPIRNPKGGFAWLPLRSTEPAGRSASMPIPRCCGCCASIWVSPAPNSAAASPRAGPARCISTGRRCAPASRRCHWSKARRSQRSKDFRPTAAIRCKKPGSTEQVPQCGYCQSGQIMQAAELLARNKAPTRADIVEHMDGNICRCGTYLKIISAIQRAAREG